MSKLSVWEQIEDENEDVQFLIGEAQEDIELHKVMDKKDWDRRMDEIEKQGYVLTL